MREYRAVKCTKCIWQDFYDVITKSSYPPRCVECGYDCKHEFFTANFSARQRRNLGRDLEIKVAFGDSGQYYKNLRDRMSRRNYPVSMRI